MSYPSKDRQREGWFTGALEITLHRQQAPHLWENKDCPPPTAGSLTNKKNTSDSQKFPSAIKSLYSGPITVRFTSNMRERFNSVCQETRAEE